MLRYSAAALLLALVCGCAKPATEMPVAATPVADSEHSVAISVPAMMCEHGCPPAIKEILAQQPGAVEVTVDFPTKTAIVTVEDKSQFDAQAAIEALAAKEYKDSTIKQQ